MTAQKEAVVYLEPVIPTLVQGLQRKLGGVETVVLQASCPTWGPRTTPPEPKRWGGALWPERNFKVREG